MPSSPMKLEQQSPASVLQVYQPGKRKEEYSSEMEYISESEYKEHSRHKRIRLCPEGDISSQQLLWNGQNGAMEINFNNQPYGTYSGDRGVIGSFQERTLSSLNGHPTDVAADSVNGERLLSAAGTHISYTDNFQPREMEMECMEGVVEPNHPSIRSEVMRGKMEDRSWSAETSPSSGLMKCYCRPSWEHEVECQPYYSDCY